MGTTTKSYDVTYSSYSGCDIVASITIPRFATKPLVIGELQTISYSTHREVSPVRTLGRINPKSFTNGPRTIAGSLIFTVFDSNLVHKIVKLIKESQNTSTTIKNTVGQYELGYTGRVKDIESYALMDEMPPFDITISFVNEYGNRSTLVVKGVVIVDEGQVMSVEDMITENTMSFMASDIQVLSSLGSISLKAPLMTSVSDTSLASISLTSGTLSPAFDPAVTIYNVTLAEGTTVPPTVTATTRDTKSTAVIAAATAIPGTTRITVTGADGRKNYYKITFKTASQVATLSTLTVGGTEVSGFSSSTYEYSVVLPYGTAAIPRVTGTATNTSARIVVRRTFVVPGTAYVTVTAGNGTTTQVYSVAFSYGNPSTEASLSMLAVSAGILAPSFSSTTYVYTATVPSNTVGVPIIYGTPVSSVATSVITQATVIPGSATIVVTAQDGVTQKTYTVNIVRAS